MDCNQCVQCQRLVGFHGKRIGAGFISLDLGWQLQGWCQQAHGPPYTAQGKVRMEIFFGFERFQPVELARGFIIGSPAQVLKLVWQSRIENLIGILC